MAKHGVAWERGFEESMATTPTLTNMHSGLTSRNLLPRAQTYTQPDWQLGVLVLISNPMSFMGILWAHM